LIVSLTKTINIGKRGLITGAIMVLKMKNNNIIEVEKEGYIRVITINRPPVNALNHNTLEKLNEVLEKFQDDDEVRALIITGKKVFSGGADVKDFAPDYHEQFMRIERYKKPLIAAINGYALGGGADLATSCHFRIIAENATIGFPEINRGVIAGGGTTQRIPRLIGKAKALELLLFGNILSADDALKIGLVNKVSKSDELMRDAKEYAKELAKKPPVVVRCTIDSIIRGLDTTIDKALEIEAENIAKVISTEDFIEGISAFIEKREPKFKGK